MLDLHNERDQLIESMRYWEEEEARDEAIANGEASFEEYAYTFEA